MDRMTDEEFAEIGKHMYTVGGQVGARDWFHECAEKLYLEAERAREAEVLFGRALQAANRYIALGREAREEGERDILLDASVLVSAALEKPGIDWDGFFAAEQRALIEEEREACAAVADRWAARWDGEREEDRLNYAVELAETIASEIRARGEKP